MRLLIAACVLVQCVLPAPAAEPDLKPSETYAVIAGVLQWPGNRLPGFPTKNRKDEELHQTLRDRGVPAEHMALLLDEQATYSGIQRAIRDIAAKAPAGATLIVYYCGHGLPAGPKRELCLANYDLIPQRPDRTGLLASELAEMIKATFRGRRVLLLADCCFSGGLKQTATALNQAGFEAAAITSASDQVVSTLNWTFTQTVIDVLKGEPFADANGDGVLSLEELGTEVQAAMKALERQQGGVALAGWKGDFTLAAAKPRPKAEGVKFQPGDYVVVTGANRAGRVIEGADGMYAVQFYDYTEKVRAKVPEASLAALPDDWLQRHKPLPTAGAEFEVQWQGQWFPAKALRKDGEKTLVHYIGFGSEWDEWVTKDRIRPLGK